LEIVSEELVAPSIGIPSRSHWKRNGDEPEAEQVKVEFKPTQALRLTGWELMLGAWA
jgi:hypothetical protein